LRLLLYITLAALIGTCSSPPPLLDQVLELGELRVVTRDSPVSYVDGPDGPSGPEFDLVRKFADELGVKLIIKTVDSISEIVPFIMSGKAHMAAAGLSITESRREYLHFGYPYQMVDMHLIYKLGTGKPRNIEDVIGRPIEVMAGSSHADMLQALSTAHSELDWTENADAEVTDLLEFLYAMTSPSLGKLAKNVPLDVPSGLPVDGRESQITAAQQRTVADRASD